MVKIPTYDGAVQRTTSSGQGAQGFSGGQIGVASDTGLSAFGKGVANMGASLNRIELDKMKKEATLWNSTSYEKVFTEYNEWQDKQESEYENPGAKGFTNDALAKFQEISDKYLGEAPNKYAIQEWKQRMNSFKMQVFKQSTAFEAEETLEYQKDQFNETVQAMGIRASINPEGWDLNTYQSSIKQILNGLDTKETDGIEGYSNLWNKNSLKAAEDKALAYIAETMITSVIDEGDPLKISMIKEMFETGRFAKVLDADKHQALKNKAFGIKQAIDKEEKRKFEVQIEDNLANVSSQGEGVHELSEEQFKYYYGENNAQYGDYLRKFDVGKKIYTHTTAISTMDLNGMSEYVNKLPDTTADQKLIKSEMAKKATQMVELMESDAVVYAQTYRKDIATKLKSDDLATRMEGYNAIIEMQESFGIRGEDKVLLGDVERSRLSQTFMDANIADKEAIQGFVLQLKNEYGDYFDDVMAELIIHGKLDKNVAAAMMYIDDPDFGSIFEASRMKLDSNALARADSETINATIQADFIAIRQALTKTNANAIPMVDGWQNLITKMVKMKVSQGMEVNEAISQVTEQYITGKYHIGEDFIVPKLSPNTNLDISQFKSVANNVLETISQSDLDFEILNSGNVTLDTYGQSTGQYKSIQGELRATNTKWRNTADGTGVELVYDFGENGYYPVYFTGPVDPPGTQGTKQKVVLSFEDMRTRITNDNIKVMEDIISYTKDGKPYIQF
tara:strand:+ start:416 stop:2617 length:2202 start_codon:yes stop_codon:yes gene_type:complete